MSLKNIDLEEILCVAKSTGADFSEIYLEDRTDTIIKDKNRSVQGVTSLHIHGAGLYLLRGTDSVYVYTNDTSKQALLELAHTAASLLPFAGKKNVSGSVLFTRQKNPVLNPVEIFPQSVSACEKIKVIKEIERAAYGAEPGIQSLDVNYFDVIQHVTIANSEGLYTEDTRVSAKIRLNGGVNWNGKSCFDFFELVSPQGFEIFRQIDYLGWAQLVICQMEDSLKVRPVKSCIVPVVFEAGDCGVFWHEACGHNLESGASLAAGSIKYFDLKQAARDISMKCRVQMKPAKHFVSGEYPVILGNSVVSYLFATGWQFFSGVKYLNKSSAFSGKLGEKISDKCLAITDKVLEAGSGFPILGDCEGSVGAGDFSIPCYGIGSCPIRLASLYLSGE